MNKKRYIGIGILLVLFIVPLISAEPSYYFRYGRDIDLKVPCFDENDNHCDDETNCTLAINYPDGGSLIPYRNMTYNPTFFNYSITYDNVNQTGDYTGIMNCMSHTDSGYETFTFEVNILGQKVTESPASIIIMIFVMFITLALFLLPKFVGKFSENEFLNLTIKYSCYIMGLFLLTLDAAMLATISAVYRVGLDSEMLTFVWIVSRVAYFTMLIVIIKLIFTSLKLWKIKKYKKRMGYDD